MLYRSVPQLLSNDLWAILFQKVDAECLKWASPAKNIIVNESKHMKPLFLELQYCK